MFLQNILDGNQYPAHAGKVYEEGFFVIMIGGCSNTSVVHMHDQRFSKLVYPKQDLPFLGKTPLNENFM